MTPQKRHRLKFRRTRRIAESLASMDDLFIGRYICNKNIRRSLLRAIVRYEFKWEYLPSQTHMGRRENIPEFDMITPERRREILLKIHAFVAEPGTIAGDSMRKLVLQFRHNQQSKRNYRKGH